MIFMFKVLYFGFYLILCTHSAQATNACLTFLSSKTDFKIATSKIDQNSYGKSHISWDQNYDEGIFNFVASLEKGTLSLSAYLVDYVNQTRSSMHGNDLFKHGLDEML